MNRRPWPILILAFFHLVEPFSKTVLMSLMYQIEMNEVWYQVILNNSWWGIFAYFALFPLAAICIYIMRPWSFATFLLIHAFVFLEHASTYGRFYQAGKISYIFILVAINVINVLAVAYFFAPVILNTIYDRRRRWWETKVRFQVYVPCEVYDRDINISLEGKILNISEGGALVEIKGDVPIFTRVAIRFPMLGHQFTFFGKVVHGRKENVCYIGVGFKSQSRFEKRQLKALANLLQNFEFEREQTNEVIGTFKEWAVELAKTGKGLYPDMRN